MKAMREQETQTFADSTQAESEVDKEITDLEVALTSLKKKKFHITNTLSTSKAKIK